MNRIVRLLRCLLVLVVFTAAGNPAEAAEKKLMPKKLTEKVVKKPGKEYVKAVSKKRVPLKLELPKFLQDGVQSNQITPPAPNVKL